MTTAQVVGTSVTVNNNSTIQDYVHPDNQNTTYFCNFIIPWCLTHRITGAPPSVSVALKIALRSLEHHGITIKLAYSS